MADFFLRRVGCDPIGHRIQQLAVEASMGRAIASAKLVIESGTIEIDCDQILSNSSVLGLKS